MLEINYLRVIVRNRTVADRENKQKKSNLFFALSFALDETWSVDLFEKQNRFPGSTRRKATGTSRSIAANSVAARKNRPQKSLRFIGIRRFEYAPQTFGMRSTSTAYTRTHHRYTRVIHTPYGRIATGRKMQREHWWRARRRSTVSFSPSVWSSLAPSSPTRVGTSVSRGGGIVLSGSSEGTHDRREPRKS